MKYQKKKSANLKPYWLAISVEPIPVSGSLGLKESAVASSLKGVSSIRIIRAWKEFLKNS